MSNSSFNLFLFKYCSGTLGEDTTWRAYDIPEVYIANRERYVRLALKDLGLKYAGELALSRFMKLYEVHDAITAERLLGCWWPWAQIVKGRYLRVPFRKGKEEPGGGFLDLPTRENLSAAQAPSQPRHSPA